MSSANVADPLAGIGAQLPRIQLVPPGAYPDTADIAVEICHLAGLELDPWQEWFLRCSLGERVDLKWAAFEVGLVVPRQNGKGTTLEARELTGLFAIDEERLIIHSAHEQVTSSEHQRRLLDLIEGVPEFEQKVLRAPRGKGQEAIELRDGSRILFKPRTSGGGRGLTGDLVVLDEAMIIPTATTSALVPTMAARSMQGNPQIWYTGSAVDKETHEHGLVLARVRARGMAGAPRLLYAEWSAPGDDPSQVPAEVLRDPEVWAQANPGLGIRISAEYVADEAGALGARGFAVERLGIGDWPNPVEGGEQIISDEEWDALFDEASKRSGPVCFAFDMTPDRRYAAISVAGKRDDGLGHVEVVEHKPGSGWLVDRVVQIVEKHQADVYCAARAPAASLLPELADRGLKVETLDSGEQAEAYGMFLDGVTGMEFRHRGPFTADLRVAVKGAAKKPLGDDASAWSRKNSSVDISPLVASTIAYWAACTKLTSGEAMVAWI